MKEIWQNIPGYENLYKISTRGRVRAFSNGKWKLRKLVKSWHGYWKINLYKEGKATTFDVHQLMQRTFFGPKKEGYEINHKDLNKKNNKLDNLEYVPQLENARHYYKSKNSHKKYISDKKRKAIFILYKEIDISSIADILGLNYSSVYSILRRGEDSVRISKHSLS